MSVIVHEYYCETEDVRHRHSKEVFEEVVWVAVQVFDLDSVQLIDDEEHGEGDCDQASVDGKVRQSHAGFILKNGVGQIKVV